MTATRVRQPSAPVLLTESEAADYLTVSVSTLRAWRGAATGPVYLKVGAAVRYRPADMDRYLEAATCPPER